MHKTWCRLCGNPPPTYDTIYDFQARNGKTQMDDQAITLRLPFPPSANHYTAIRVVKIKGKHIPMHYRTARANKFYREVLDTVLIHALGARLEGRLALSIELSAPTRRSYDISNAVKCIEDALQEGGLFIDDSQIDELHVTRLPKDEAKNGFADVVIQPIRPNDK